MNDLAGIRYGAEITSAARRYGLDPKLLAGVAAQETGGPGAASGNNVLGDGGHGHGLFQIDDRTWAFAKTPAAMIPASNANAAAQILSANLTRYGGDVRAALSAYNAGSPGAIGTTTTWSDGRTLGYADSVLRHVAELGGATGQLAAEAPTTSASVNALANYRAAAPAAAPRAAAPASALGHSGVASAAYASSNVELPELESMLAQSASAPSSAASSSSGSQFTPVRTWASMTSGQSGSGGGQAGSAADQGMADILDQQSVFGADAD